MEPFTHVKESVRYDCYTPLAWDIADDEIIIPQDVRAMESLE